MEAAQKLPIPNAYVEVTDGVCAGRPHIANTRIKVSQIASEYEHNGMMPDEIVEAHADLSLAQIHAALAYFYDHQDDIRREWRENDDLTASLRALYPSRLGRGSASRRA